jgi:hypothetical protein
MPGRSSGEFERDEPTLRWQMEYVIKTLEGINKDLTVLKISDGVMEERVKTLAANAVDSRSKGWTILTIVISIVLSAVVSYMMSHIK